MAVVGLSGATGPAGHALVVSDQLDAGGRQLGGRLRRLARAHQRADIGRPWGFDAAANTPGALVSGPLTGVVDASVFQVLPIKVLIPSVAGGTPAHDVSFTLELYVSATLRLRYDRRSRRATSGQ